MFLNYIMGFAQEGETTLIVWQKPQKELYLDGTPKYVWPAFLPEKWVAGRAWYGNTGIFITDRFNGKPSAGAAMCDFVGCMVLDDIGTKSKIPPLPPTWVMETSAGNFQWGYGFSEQPTKGDFSAAIIAVAEAGYTDKGAINPVRNFRLPGSVNLKEGRGLFASQLIEFHPEREYTLDEICTALGVVPAMANTATHKAIAMLDDGGDDVLAWVRDKGMLLEAPNGSGWAGVLCPNHHEHSDGNGGGRYNPVNRAYCCLHAHCGDWDSERFLAWVEEGGGPSQYHGLRSELLVAKLAPALLKISHLREVSQFSAETGAAEVIRQVDIRELGRISKDRLHEHFMYVEDDDAYFDLVTRRELTRGTFNAVYRGLDCRRNGRVVEASIWFDFERVARGCKTLAGITYAAGEATVWNVDGLDYGNRWIDARPGGVVGDVAPWMAHMESLIPLEFEREHLLNVMACKAQFPKLKINHAVLLGGAPGVGKDTLFAPFFYTVCGAHERNKSLVDTKTLESQFGYGLESEIMLVNELRPDQFKDKRALENTLKPVIAAPPNYLTVNRKGLHPYQALNRVLVMACTNHRDAIALPSEDRRWFCLWAEGGHMPVEDSRALWAWYRAGGFAAVSEYIMGRDVSKFNPATCPPMTEAKKIMIEQARSGAEEFVIEEIVNRKGDFTRGVVGAPFHSIVDRLMGRAPTGMKINLGVLFHALGEAGWRDMGRVISSDLNTPKRVFAAAELQKLSKSDMRRMVEKTVEGLKIVK